MRITGYLLSTLLALCAAPAVTTAATASSPANEMIRLYSPPQEFHLFSQMGDKTLRYDSERNVKVCARNGRNMTALEVTHDGSNSVVKPGDCRQFTSRNFNISPKGRVTGNYLLQGKIRNAS